ncbi:hypothetical protein E2R68_00600 [Psychromonas sp. RZ22]|uniref:hypothetical protein n=1 Tax=Psychromonas algarum TaxID=2555643 RepID=UPI00106780FD|nr:hypothetical protein [Psychromonas sp. RZ22]TEW56568.1 hypothetical protein E2R68_00600 [Psychromonas sp. RZ22]
MKIKAIILLAMTMLLSGCYDEPSDKGCIKQFDELTINFQECMSKNKYMSYHNIYYLDEDSDIHEIKKEDNLLDADEINVKNARQALLAKSSISNLSIKQNFTKTAWQSIGYYLVILIVIGSIFKTLMKGFNLPKTLSIVGMQAGLGLLLSLLMFSNMVEVFQSRTAMKAGDITYKTLAKTATFKQRTSRHNLNSYHMNEGLIDVESLHKINVCLSNNIKNNLENIQNNSTNVFTKYFNNETDLYDFFKSKNRPYVKYFEKRTNQKISYTIGVGGTISKVEFADCGSVTFPDKKITDDLLEAMKSIEYKEILHNSIINSSVEGSFENGWKDIEAKMRDKYAYSNNLKSRLVQLLVHYSIESKKGVLFGSVLTDYKRVRPEIKEKSYKNLESFLNNSDELYRKINEVACLKNEELTRDAKIELDDYKKGNHAAITEFNCIDFHDSKIDLAIDDIYIYSVDQSRDEAIPFINSEIEFALEESAPIVEKSYVDVVKQYGIVNTHFLNKIDSFYDDQLDLAELINEGHTSAGKFYRYLNQKGDKYEHLFSEIVDVANIDFRQSLPNYSNANLDSADVHYYNTSFVNAFMNPITDKINHEQSANTTNIASNALEYSVDSSNLNIDTDNLLTTTNVKNVLLTTFESGHKVFSGIKRLSCKNSDISCLEQMRNQDGVIEINNLSANLDSLGKGLIVQGFAVKTAQLGLEMVTKSSKEDKAQFGKRKVSSKTRTHNISRISNSVIDMLKVVSNTQLTLGGIAVTMAGSIKLIHEISSIIMISIMSKQLLIQSTLGILMICTILMGFFTNFFKAEEDYKNTYLSLFFLFTFSIVINVSSMFVLFLLHLILNVGLDFLPMILKSILGQFSSNVLAEILGYGLCLFILVFGVLFGYLKIGHYILKQFSAVTFGSIKGTFTKTSQDLESVKSLAKVATGATVISKLDDIKKQKQQST